MSTNRTLMVLIALSLSTQLFSTSDAQNREGGVTQPRGLIEEGAEIEKLATGLQFTEGPVWVPEKKILVFSDIPTGRLMQWSPEKGLSEYRKTEKANGNILDRKGRIISCQHFGRNVVREEADGTITVLIDNYDGKRFNSPNDVAERSDGTLWFTDPSWGLEGRKHELPGHWVFKFDPKTGAIAPVIKDLAMPNGIHFSPDEKRLYVADTGGHRSHPDPTYHHSLPCIRCYEVSTGGELGKILYTINRGSDGMAVDSKGNLYTTDGGKIIVYHDADRIGEIEVPENPANICFGGDDGKTLFITAQTSLYSIRTKNSGAKLPDLGQD